MTPEHFASMGDEPSRRRKWANRTGLVAAGIAAGVGSTLGIQAINHHLNIDIHTVKPTGVWESPKDEENVSDIIHFAAKAYPRHQDEPPIAFVDFNAVIKGTKLLACHVPAPPPQTSDFTCDYQIPEPLKVPGQKIIVSFDVHDSSGNVTNTTNGPHTVFEN